IIWHLTLALAVLQLSFVIPLELIQVRIFAHLKIRALTLSTVSGNYRMVADGTIVERFRSGLPVSLSLKNDSLLIIQEDRELGIYSSVKFFGSKDAELKIKLSDPDRKLR